MFEYVERLRQYARRVRQITALTVHRWLGFSGQSRRVNLVRGP